MQKLKFTLFSLRDFLVAFGPVLALFCGLVYLGYRLADPAPSRLVDMTSGVQGSTYERFARAYSSELAKSGVTLRNANSEGSQQNFERIRDPDSVYEVGFVRSGSTDPEQATEQGLISLGALFYEPIWIFYRSKTDWRSLTQLKGKRINLGARGSGITYFYRIAATESFAGSRCQHSAFAGSAGAGEFSARRNRCTGVLYRQ
jgi:TRAP-type uncharacterized transport system substrate-binding protein